MRDEDRYQPHGERYHQFPRDVAGKSNTQLMSCLKSYSPLSEYDKARPQFRQWRRLIVREALKRRLITSDPGGAP